MNHKQSIFALLAGATLGVSSAQDAAPGGGLEEITVTAQRREQRLQDVPIAISAYTAEQLQARQIVDTYDIVRNIPNLTGNANVGVGTSTSLYVRGLGNAESIATFDLPVGTYVDDVYISRQNHNNFSMFDVQRIEVLRGPQGTLFGRNTTGGAINVVMKKPSRDRKAFVEAGVGRFGLWQVRGSVDLPVSERFLTKFSVYKVKDDGYATQASTGIKFNDRDSTGVRVDLRFLPSDALTIDLIADYVKDRNTNFLNVLDANGNRVVNNRIVQGGLVGFFVGPKAALKPGNEAKTKDVTLNINWDVSSNISFASITGWRKTDHDFLVDSGGDAPRNSTTRGYTPLANLGDHKQLSQEFKFNGKSLGDQLNWVAGLYYMQERNVTDFGSANGNTAAAGGPLLAADRTMKNSLDAYAGYGQADYKLDQHWTLTAGIRYTSEKKDFSIDRNPGAGGAALSTAAIAATGTPLELTAKLWTPRFAISYALNDDVMLFASRTRGFKSGGWPARAVLNTAFAPFKPEKIWSNEIGVRADLFNKTLRMNATYFRSITDDVQIPARIDFNGLQISTTTNPAALANHGLEIDADWVPTENFSFNAGLGWQRAQYEKISTAVQNQAAACRANPVGLFNGAPACNANFVDFFGNIARPVRAPDYNISLSATYHMHVGSVVISPTFGYNYSAEYAIGTTGTPENVDAPARVPFLGLQGAAQTTAVNNAAAAALTWSKPQAYINAGITLEFKNLPGLTISADCRNCADKAYPMSSLGIFQFLDRPGSWGVRARYKF